ncbi:metG, partial [Symbiodinium necroappetens]
PCPMSEISLHTLECGLPTLFERIPGVRSAAMCWLLPAGTACEPEGLQGLAPMHAEMLARGAGNLDSRAQADAYDALGISRGFSAQTWNLSFTTVLTGARLVESLPLMVANVREPRMSADSFEPARALCVQAVQSLDDDPGERVMVTARGAHAPAPINRPSMGTLEGLASLDPGVVAETWRERAVPGGSILAFAGDVDEKAIVGKLNGLLAGFAGEGPGVSIADDAPRGYHHEAGDTNQVHIAVVHDSPAETSEDAFRERLVSAVLSGGMSSRLFTEVREKRSLCYSVYASYGAEAAYGRTVAYVGTTPERAQESLDVLVDQLERINSPEGAITREEFDRAAIGMKSRLVMSGESTSARAGAIARDFRKLGRARSLEELTGAIDALTLDEVNAYLARRRLGTLTVCTIGPSELSMPGVPGGADGGGGVPTIGRMTPYYVTTPIYYVNDAPHIGHCYTTLLADVLARFHRLAGRDVFFLTGTDEHAEKVVTSAEQRGLTPIEWADRNADAFREAFGLMGFSNDDFIRTTEDRHKEKVTAYIAELQERGDVELGEYEGWWDPSQEEYVTENEAREHEFKSPVTGKDLVKRTEHNYFFRLSKYADRLQAHIEANPGFILPESRRNEVLGRIKQGLRDVPISRAIDEADPSSTWGIRMPGDEGHRVYVWIDALFNYLSVVDTGDRGKYWPAQAHLIAKDILWFHAVIWPCMLMALD